MDARAALGCDLPEIGAILDDSLAKARSVMDDAGLAAWLEAGGRLWRSLRDPDTLATWLETVPDMVARTDASAIGPAAETALYLSRVPDLAVHRDFLSVLPALARRLDSADSLRTWFRLYTRVANLARQGAAPLLVTAPSVLEQVNLEGMAAWIDFALTNLRGHPVQQAAYFAFKTPESFAVLQRQRHGTLLADCERELRLNLWAFWGLDLDIHPFAQSRQPQPHTDKLGLHLPDLLDDRDGIAARDVYRAMLAHLAAHRTWSRPHTADNFSQLQHVAVEVFEDSRVEHLAMRRFPGLRRLFLALHPAPREGAVPEGWSSVRHRLTILSRAILDPDHAYADPLIREWAGRFHARFAENPLDPDMAAELGRKALAALRLPDFGLPRVWFEDTVVPYRDDNRFLWRFLEDTESEDDFHSDHGTKDPPAREFAGMLPVHYPEWDYQAKEYRPDWTTLYRSPGRPGSAASIDRLLDKNAVTARAIKRVIDRLKPQQRRRIRRRPEGDDLDFDQVIRALADLRAGAEPDLRVYQSHVKDGRDIAVLLLLDLSQSINDKAGEATLLQLSQEAATLLAWSVEQLGDALAIAGFASKGRHEIRYTHYKDFAEPWGEMPKARLAAMEAGLATRMGAALRHAGAELAARREEKKLLLLLSDGEPADIDVDDDSYLKWDTHMAVTELRAQGIATMCMTLDGKADAYVADIFGPNGFAVVDKVESLPDRLTRLFLSLTK